MIAPFKLIFCFQYTKLRHGWQYKIFRLFSNWVFTNRKTSAIIRCVLASWCSRLARQPVTLEVDGSSPFEVAKKEVIPSGMTSFFVIRRTDSKGGSWRQFGELSQPTWLARRRASPFEVIFCAAENVNESVRGRSPHLSLRTSAHTGVAISGVTSTASGDSHVGPLGLLGMTYFWCVQQYDKLKFTLPLSADPSLYHNPCFSSINP